MPKISWAIAKTMLGGQIGKAAVLIPLVGYALLFSDLVQELWRFQPLLAQHAADFSVWRPRCVYYGLIFLAIAQSIYFLAAHRIAKKYESTSDFIRSEESILFAIRHSPDLRVSPGAPEYVNGLFKLEEHFNVGHRRHDEGELRTIAFHCIFEGAQGFRPIALRFCLSCASLGYALLFLPSADLFVRVTASLFSY